MYFAGCGEPHTASCSGVWRLPERLRPGSERVGQIQFQRLPHALEQPAAGGPVLEYRAEPSVSVVEGVGDVDKCEAAVGIRRYGRVSDLLGRQPQVLHVRGEQMPDRAQQTALLEGRLELGDAIAVQRVNGGRVEVVRRDVAQDLLANTVVRDDTERVENVVRLLRP